MTAEGRPLLSAVEAARRLGVKPETLYAYVSRGYLSSARSTDGRRSAFDPAEIDRLQNRPRKAGSRGGLDIRTRLSVVRQGRLLYRGEPATELSERLSFEAVARLLWTGTPEPARFTVPGELVDAARAAAAAMPSNLPIIEHVRVAVGALGAADPLRADLRPASVAATAATMIAGIVGAVPEADSGSAPGRSVAEQLWRGLTGSSARAEHERLLDTALTLLADDEPGSPVVAARLVASARAHPYAAVAAALAATAAPGGTPASAPIHRALADAEREGMGAVLSRLLGERRGVPGFGHRLYPDGDPRARVLLNRLAAAPPDADRWERVTRFVAASTRGTPVPPNVDFALAALSYTAGMPPDAGEAVFAVGRMAGWLAHVIEEYAEEPGRLRAATTYLGP